MNRVLMQLVVDAIAFLELSEADTVNPDAAIKQTESIAFHLKSLSPDDLRTFLAFLEEKAVECDMQGDRDGRGALMRSLPDALGLAGSDSN